MMKANGNRRTHLPREGTIARQLIDTWADPSLSGGRDGEIRFGDALELYCAYSKRYGELRGHMRQAFRSRAGMNVSKILNAYGHKQGKPNDRTPWIFDGPTGVDPDFAPGDTVQVNRGGQPQFATITAKFGDVMSVVFNDGSGVVDLGLIKRDCDLQPGGWKRNLLNLNRKPTQSPTLQVILASLGALTQEERAQVASACVLFTA